MRIMIDTNIIISALLFPRSQIKKIVNNIIDKHILILSSYCSEELERLFNIKFHVYSGLLKEFLLSNEIEYFITPEYKKTQYPAIRDEKDYPILVSLIESGADMLITGDKDFFTPELNGYNICTPDYYYRNYMKKT